MNDMTYTQKRIFACFRRVGFTTYKQVVDSAIATYPQMPVNEATYQFYLDEVARQQRDGIEKRNTYFSERPEELVDIMNSQIAL